MVLKGLTCRLTHPSPQHRSRPLKSAQTLCERNPFVNFEVLVCGVGPAEIFFGNDAGLRHLPANLRLAKTNGTLFFSFQHVPSSMLSSCLAKGGGHHLFFFLFSFFPSSPLPSVYSLSVLSLSVVFQYLPEGSFYTHLVPSFPLRGYPWITLHSWVLQGCNKWRDGSW